MEEDLAVFLPDWGEEGTIDGAPVFGIFADPTAVNPIGGPGMSTAYPCFLLAAATVPTRTSLQDDPVLELPLRQAAGKPWRYLVRQTDEDGSTVDGGFATLSLEQHQDQT